MRTRILVMATRYLMPLMVFFSIFVLLRGHDMPGGGFAAGMITAAAYVLYFFVHGVGGEQASIPLSAREMVGLGLTLALTSALTPWVAGREVFNTLHWGSVGGVTVGTALLFELGVYFAVAGACVRVFASLMELD